MNLFLIGSTQGAHYLMASLTENWGDGASTTKMFIPKHQKKWQAKAKTNVINIFEHICTPVALTRRA